MVCLCGCGPSVEGTVDDSPGTGGTSADAPSSATTGGPTSAADSSGVDTGGTMDDTEGSTTGGAASLCLEAWTFQEIRGEAQIVDLVGDDDLDELWPPAGFEVTAYSLRDGTASLAFEHTFEVGTGSSLGDIDGDGRMELVSRPADGGVEVHTIGEDGTISDFAPGAIFQDGTLGHFVDLDGDGDDDTLSFDNDAQQLRYAFNVDRSFAPQPAVDVSAFVMGNNWLNRLRTLEDGRAVMELVGGNDSLGDQIVLFDSVAASFDMLGAPTDRKNLIAVRDLDDDGDRDVLVGNRDGDITEIAVFWQEPTELRREVLTDRGASAGAVGDFEGTGDLQLLFFGPDTTYLHRLSTGEEVRVEEIGAPIARISGAANFEPGPADEVYVEFCEFTCVSGYGRLGPCP